MKTFYHILVSVFSLCLLLLLAACGPSVSSQTNVQPTPTVDKSFQSQRTPIPTVPPYRCAAWSSNRRATEAFAHHWQENESHAEDTEMWSKLDAAAQVEFGCSLSDLQRFAVGAFTISEDLDPASAHLELSDFVDRLVKELGWSREQISHVLGLLT